MVDRNETTTPYLNDLALKAGTTLNSISSERHFSAPSRVTEDLILTLANAYENRRAIQVSQWEQMRRRTVRQAA